MKPTAAAHSSLKKLAARGLAGGLLAGAIAALSFGSVAGAQSIGAFNSNQPVNYAADRIELQDRQNRVVLSGDVVITQGDLRLTAARTTVAYNDAGTLRIQRIDATGGVTVTRGNERASGSAAVYDFNRRVIMLSGNVRPAPRRRYAGWRATGDRSQFRPFQRGWGRQYGQRSARPRFGHFCSAGQRVGGGERRFSYASKFLCRQQMQMDKIARNGRMRSARLFGVSPALTAAGLNARIAQRLAAA